MNLPEPYASAPTPRTNKAIRKWQGWKYYLLPEQTPPTNAQAFVNPEDVEKLERENIWLREVVEKLKDVAQTFEHKHSKGKEALSAYNQLQECLKSTNKA